MSGIPRHVVKCRVFRHSSRHAMSLSRRHDQRHVANMSRHDTPCLQMKAQDDTTQKDIPCLALQHVFTLDFVFRPMTSGNQHCSIYLASIASTFFFLVTASGIVIHLHITPTPSLTWYPNPNKDQILYRYCQ
jgi:hypothetical protein